MLSAFLFYDFMMLNIFVTRYHDVIVSDSICDDFNDLYPLSKNSLEILPDAFHSKFSHHHLGVSFLILSSTSFSCGYIIFYCVTLWYGILSVWAFAQIKKRALWANKHS